MESKTPREQGTVKFFNWAKGFGFIRPANGGDDIFVHQSVIHARKFRSLAEEEPVEYDLAYDPALERTYAANVTGPGGAYVQGAPRTKKKKEAGGSVGGETADDGDGRDDGEGDGEGDGDGELKEPTGITNPDGQRQHGRVKFFNRLKGFGFIRPADGGDDIFVHQSAIRARKFRSLAGEEPIEYDLAYDPALARTYAANVTGPGGVFVRGAPRTFKSKDQFNR